jgi:transcriptional regulator with XRE-family HTH domain
VPTVASGRLARELRDRREKAGLSQESVAQEMGWAESKLYRIENDKSRVLVRDVKRLIKLYKVRGKEEDALLELAGLAGEPEWWHPYSGAIPEWFQLYVVLESSASELNGYESELAPGIMQTENYMRAIMRTAPNHDDDEAIEGKITVRANRQARLTGDDPLSVWLVLNEAVIRRVVGGPQVMREQLEHLITLSELRNVTLQVLPFAIGEHAAMHGAFKLLKFPTPGDPHKVYLEEQVGGIYTQKDQEVDRYALMFDHLRARAHGPEQTRALLHEAALQLSP